MIRGMLAVATVALVGCKGGEDTEDTDVVDTDVDTEPVVEPDASFVVVDPPASALVSLTWADARTFGEGMPVIDPTAFATATVDADGVAAFVGLGTPAPAKLYPPDDENTEVKLALYLPTVHDDVDGDGALSGDEPILGLSPVWLAYLEGTVSGDLAAAGFVAGWNALVVTMGEGDPIAVGRIGNALPQNLVANPSLTLGGDVMFEVGASHRLGLLVPGGEGIDGEIVDVALTDPWSMTVAGRPDPSFLNPIEGSPVEAAVAIPVAFDDKDASKTWSDGDAWMGTACWSDGATSGTVVAAWLEAPTDVLSALYMTTNGGARPGWNGFAVLNDQPTFLTPEQLAMVPLTMGCGPR